MRRSSHQLESATSPSVPAGAQWETLPDGKAPDSLPRLVNHSPAPRNVIIIGAGPAGLTSAYLLSKEGFPAAVLEGDPQYVGGISKTVTYKGYAFDIGGHRFFSKSKEVEDLWTEILPDDMLIRPRSSRIYYNGKFFSYPLKAIEAFLRLGPIEAAHCVLSYFYAQLFPVKNPRSFQDWVSNQFGQRLFNIFFKTYTEKVWGMSCKDISADWAAQRIKGLSLSRAILASLLPKRRKGGAVIKTLIDSFRYPRKGPGMMWERCTEKVRELGGTVELGRRVSHCTWDAAGKLWEVESVNGAGETRIDHAGHLISTTPIRELAEMLEPPLSEAAALAAKALNYRDFITVVMIAKEQDRFTDNWIYIHDPSVKVGRIQNFKSWSPEMVPDPSMACYGLEYFCFEGDGLWNSEDAALLALGEREMIQLGFAKPGEIVDGCVVRQKKAYPVYDEDYSKHLLVIRKELEAKFPTLHLIGRNGMHKYNNQDHSMMTAMLCAKNILGEQQQYDLWQVNEDAEYHESGERGESSVSGQRLTPKRIASPAEK